MQGDGGLDNALVMILVIFAGALFGGGSMGRIHGNNKHRLVAMVVFLAVDFRSIFFICWCWCYYYFVKPLLLLNTIRDPSFLHCSPKVWWNQNHRTPKDSQDGFPPSKVLEFIANVVAHGDRYVNKCPGDPRFSQWALHGFTMAFPAAPGILSGRTLWGYFRCPGTTPWWRTTLWTSLRIGGGADESLDIFGHLPNFIRKKA